MTKGRVVDQGALPQLAPHLLRLVSLQVKIKPRAGAKHGRAPACARDQAADGVSRIGGLRNHAPVPIATTSVSPCRTRASASAANSQVREPVKRSAGPPTARTAVSGE